MTSPARVIALCICALASPPALAQQIASARVAGMGDAHRAVGTSNDTLFANPAGMSLFPRYSLEAFWRRNTEKHITQWSLSVVDSRSGPVAGGIAYTFEWIGKKGEKRRGSRVDVGTSYALANFLYAGLTLKYVGLTTEEGEVTQITGDTGFLFVIGEFLFIGLVVENAVNPVETTNAAPRLFGGGVAMIFGTLQLAYDYRQSVEIEGSPNSHYLGAEWFFGGSWALRGGWVTDQILEENRWTTGLGYVSPTWGVDLAYSHTIKNSTRGQYFSLGFRFFL